MNELLPEDQPLSFYFRYLPLHRDLILRSQFVDKVLLELAQGENRAFREFFTAFLTLESIQKNAGKRV